MKDTIPIVTTYAFVYFACHRTREMESWGRERERENSKPKTLFYKDCSLGSVRI